MPTAEGVFPKVGNDPLYASEVNRFSTAGRLLYIGSLGTLLISGTGYQSMGSVVVPAGSMFNPCNIDIQQICASTFAGANVGFPLLKLVSTPGGTIIYGSGAGIRGQFNQINILIGSPLIGGMKATTISNEQGAPHADTFLNNYTSVSHVDTSQAVVFDFQGTIDTGSLVTGALVIKASDLGK